MRKLKTSADPIWYPFTQMKAYADTSPDSIAAGEGCWLIDESGRRYLDGVSSLWTNVHGHCHPTINAAIHAQVDTIAHSTLLGSSHAPARELARRLIDITPARLTRVFYSDAGATAVEIAIKLAYQFWQLQGETQRRSFIKLGESYHGDTIGSISVGGMDLFHDRFRHLLFPTHTIPTPHAYRHPYGDLAEAAVVERYFAAAESVISQHAHETCAVIVEPLMQGAAGMIVHPKGYLKHLRELTRQHNLLLIADEVAVGFGRTGKMFACEWEDVEPDLMCLAKGITGGYLPLAATLAAEEIFTMFLGDYAELKTFFHGHTYTGNPLGCVAALASLDVFKAERTLADDVFEPKAKRYAAGMQRLGELAQVGSTRWRGMMGGVELVRDKKTKEAYPFAERVGHRIAMEARKHGVWLRPLGDVIVLLPPLAISLDELDLLFTATEKAIRSVTAGAG